MGILAPFPARLAECLPQEVLDLRVQAPQLVRRPLLEGGMEIAVEPQQEGLAIRQNAPVSPCRASRR